MRWISLQARIYPSLDTEDESLVSVQLSASELIGGERKECLGDGHWTYRDDYGRWNLFSNRRHI